MPEQITANEIASILDNNVSDVVELMADLDLAGMKMLAQLEQEGKRREGVMRPAAERIAEMEAAQQEDDPDATDDNDQPPVNPQDTDVTPLDEGAEDEPSAKQSRGEELPEWKKPDYSGSLTIDQAEWRTKHIGATEVTGRK